MLSPRLSRILTFASVVVGGALAQDWGTTGQWEIMAPANTGPPLAYRGASTVAGTVVFVGNSSTGAISAWAFDPHLNTFTKWPDVPPAAVQINDPFSFVCGGTLFICDETNVSAIAMIDAGAATSDVGYTWSTPFVLGGPAVPRFGQRFLAWGSLILFFSGVDIATGVLHNDIWGIDATLVAAATNLSPPPLIPLSWNMIADDNTQGFPPGKFPLPLSLSFHAHTPRTRACTQARTRAHV